MAYLQPNPFFHGVVRMLMVDHEVCTRSGLCIAQYLNEYLVPSW